MSTISGIAAQSIEALYRDHHSWLYGWLCKRLGKADYAADLVQDTFLRVLTRTDFTDVNEPRPWLLTIAKRLLIDKSRRQKLEQAYLDEYRTFLESSPAYAPSAEQVQLAIQVLELVACVLDQLAEKPQRAFIMRHIDGLTLAEISHELEVSLTMVRKYLVHGLVLCHAAIEDVQMAESKK